MLPSRGKTSLIYQAALPGTEAAERLVWMAAGSGRWAGRCTQISCAGLAGTGWCSRVGGWEGSGRVRGPAALGIGENLWLDTAQCWSPLRPHEVTFLCVPSDEMNVNLKLILSVFGSLNTPGFLSSADL